MRELDLSTNPRIPLLVELVRSMGRCNNPRQLLECFVDAMRRAYSPRCYVQLATRGLGAGQYRVHRLLTEGGRELVDVVDPAMLSTLPIHGSGIFSSAIASGSPRILCDLDLHDDPVFGSKLAEYRSLMAVPIVDGLIGIDWVVIFERDPCGFSEEGLEQLIIRANLLGAMASNLETSRRLEAATLHIQREIDAIGKIQRALLPEELPEIPGVAMAASYATFDRAGGDLYDVARLGNRAEDSNAAKDERFALLIGDVSGHGPAAAVMMAIFHAILHAYPLRPKGPAEVLTHINRHLCDKRIDQSFITAFLGFYEPATRKLTYARAGHNPPVLKDFPHIGAPIHLDAVGEIPLGIFPQVHYSEASITLHPGQTLILYTDGITEAKRPGGEMFGVEGIENSLIHCTGAPECAIEHITTALKSHQVGMRPNDDQTVLAMQVVALKEG
jgi:sigma-B regulation protein RsbU (phosphoserine phosphatase)